MCTSEVTIQFNSYYQLREFMRRIDTEFYDVSFTKFTITCHCTKENLDLAVEQYNGKIIKAKQ